MANFDPNEWYHLTVASLKSQAFLGTNLFDKGRYGAVFFNTTTDSAPRQRWQIFKVSSNSSDGRYVLRTGEGGPNAYLSTEIGNNTANSASNVGNTLPNMANASVLSGDEMYWGIQSWGDGTFFLYNYANGSDWHLEEGNGLAFMSSNISAPSDAQRFSFPSIGVSVNDETFSSIAQPASSSTSTIPPSTTTSSPSSSSSSSSSSSGGGGSSHTTTIAVAVGVSLGVAIIVLLGILFWLKKAKARKAARERQLAELNGDSQTQQYAGYTGELNGHVPGKYYAAAKMLGDPPSELHSEPVGELQSVPIGELPSSPVERQHQQSPGALHPNHYIPDNHTSYTPTASPDSKSPP